MNQVNCPICGKKCVKSGKTKAGSQRWPCKSCRTSLTHKIDNQSKELGIFLDLAIRKRITISYARRGKNIQEKDFEVLEHMADATEGGRIQRCAVS